MRDSSSAMPLSCSSSNHRERYPFVYDLGQTWKDWTGQPFVFAVWVAQRATDVKEALVAHASLITSRNWGLEHLSELAEQAHKATGVADDCLRGISVRARLRTVLSAPCRPHRVLSPARRARAHSQRHSHFSARRMSETTRSSRLLHQRPAPRARRRGRSRAPAEASRRTRSPTSSTGTSTTPTSASPIAGSARSRAVRSTAKGTRSPSSRSARRSTS